MEGKILVSACLAGFPCRYDGKTKGIPEIEKLVRQGKALPFCPEVESGLPTPRVPSEIKDGQVINKNGDNMTEYFKLGAERTLKFCQDNNINQAILKANSPSCGKDKVYDGTFSGNLIPGEGITAKVLRESGIQIKDEEEFLSE